MDKIILRSAHISTNVNDRNSLVLAANAQFWRSFNIFKADFGHIKLSPCTVYECTNKLYACTQEMNDWCIKLNIAFSSYFNPFIIQQYGVNESQTIFTLHQIRVFVCFYVQIIMPKSNSP